MVVCSFDGSQYLSCFFLLPFTLFYRQTFRRAPTMVAIRCFIAFLVIFLGVEGTGKDPQWARKLQEVLQARDATMPIFETLKTEGNAL